MSRTESSFTSAADGVEVFTTTWPDVDGAPKGVVQIAHGLAEHVARYDRFAAALNAAGYVAAGTDHRAHGRTGADALGDFGTAGFEGLIADVVQFGRELAADHPGVPVFLFGHSMGSFASQSVIADGGEPYAGVILSGSTAMDVLAANMAEAPPEAAGLEAFNAGFEHRTGYEWLSRDTAEVDAYVADPWCGFDAPPEAMGQLFGQAARLGDPAVLAEIPSTLPILLVSGDADPLAGGGQLIELAAQRYRDAGVADVTATLYPGGRHELLNETNRDEVTADVIGWLDARAAG